MTVDPVKKLMRTPSLKLAHRLSQSERVNARLAEISLQRIDQHLVASGQQVVSRDAPQRRRLGNEGGAQHRTSCIDYRRWFDRIGYSP